MSNTQFSNTEKAMVNFDLASLNLDAAKANIASATSAADVKTEICNVWSKIRPYVILAENIPVIGKYVSILAELLDAICGAPAAALAAAGTGK